MILNTLTELEKFALETPCLECTQEAAELIGILRTPGMDTIEIVFETECSHAPPLP